MRVEAELAAIEGRAQAAEVQAARAERERRLAAGRDLGDKLTHLKERITGRG